MDQNLLKTSGKQRVIFSIIAVIMIFSFIASYAAIILANGNNTSASSKTAALVSKYEAEYNNVAAEIPAATTDYFNSFAKYTSRMTAYNEAAANAGGVEVVDLEIGSGRLLESGDKNYLSFYAGWCPDETVFDSSINNINNPTAFKSVLNAENGLIEGWELGVVGMRLGGIREITIPGELAYADQREICGGYNKPLKFIVMAVENSGTLADVAERFEMAQLKLQYAYYGIDYDATVTTEGDAE